MFQVLHRPSHPSLAFGLPPWSSHSLRKRHKSAVRHSLSASGRVQRLRPPALLRAAITNSTTADMATNSADENSCQSSSEPSCLYFCYGSNMVREKLQNRGLSSASPISFTQVWTARLPDWQLCFDLRGAPPQEPAMASIRQQQGDEVYGLVYRIGSDACWKKLLASEGVTEHHGRYDSYHVVPVEVECFQAETPSERSKVWVRTLVTNPKFSLPSRLQRVVRPSQRYMNLLIQGARQEQLPPKYIQRLEAAPVARRWQPSLLLMVMNITIPFSFLMRRKSMRYMIYPLTKVGFMLYAMHESLALHPKGNRALREVGLWFCRTFLFLLYSVYVVPSILVVIFDPRGRQIYNVLKKKYVRQVQDKPAQSATPA